MKFKVMMSLCDDESPQLSSSLTEAIKSTFCSDKNAKHLGNQDKNQKIWTASCIFLKPSLNTFIKVRDTDAPR